MHAYICCMKNQRFINSICVHMRCVHYNLYKHACILGSSPPNMVCMYLGMYKNCKPRIKVHISSINNNIYLYKDVISIVTQDANANTEFSTLN